MYIQPCFFIFTFIIMSMQLYDQLFLTYNQNLVQLFELNINLNIKLMSKQLANQQSNQVISSTQDIAALLQFQQKLLHLVHSQIYNKPTVDEDDIVKFQINYVSEINEAWKRMIQDLMFRLVKQRIPYDSALRDHFHKVLAVQFLPFLRINKHELTQVSLYGFDIYIQPLSAILQILNRIDGQRHILIKYNSQKKQQSVWNQKPQDIWQCVKKGWNQFIYQTSLFKISLNVYMLKQYLKIGAKSLVKKDKQIVFTGCCNLFTELLHILKRCKQIWLLCELSQLNTQLYQFHPSFNYSHFYSLMFPIVKQYEPVFNSMRVVGQKCLNANILTPLLLSVLRNRQSFHLFIEQADHQCWIPYLNGIVFGFMYNFKARILEYEEAMQVLIGAILKLGVMDALKIEYFMGQLPKQWNEVREYFISALKIGYNVGQLQTWHPTQFDKIQQRIINCTKDSLLMHSGLPAQVQMNVYFSKGFDWELESCLQQIAGSLLNKQQLTSSFSPKIAQVIEVNNFTIYCILRLSHLIKLCKLTNNIHCICYIINFLNKIGLVDSIVLRRRLSEIGDLFSEVAIKQIEKQQRGRQDLKQVLFLYIKKNKPTTKIFEIIKVCLMISTPKQAASQIISIVQSQHVELQSIFNLAEFIASSMIGMYCPQRMSGSIKVKTFEKEYSIEQEVINMNNRLHSCINVLVEAIVQRKSVKSVQVLVWIAKLCNWIVIPLINFPVSTRYDPKQESKKLQSFGIWLITNPEQYPLLFQLLSIGMSITSSQIKIYFTQIALINICDQIILQLNRVLCQLSELQDNMQYRYILKLLQIFVVIYPLSKSALSVQINKKVMKLYLRCVQKLDTIISNTQDDNIIQEVVRSVYEIYCPLIDLIFQTTDSSRKWRKYMRKLCLVSLEINTQKVNNVREFELSSIRKDKGFLIHNPVEFNDKTENLNNNLRLKSRIETLLNESKRYTNKNIFNSKQELYSKPQYLISCLQIRDFQPDPKEKDSGFYSKQYLLPYLSEKTITLLFKSCSETSVQLLTDLLSMSPSNHNRLVQWGIANNNKDILKTIGISKQAVQIHFPQILNIVPNQQFPALVAHLDYQSKKSISDNFNLVTMKQRIQGTAEQCKQKHLIIDLSQDLAFLLVLNQSNWRYANELINNIGTNKQSGLSNIPSMLLQYLEYIRITSQSNQDYEVKADIFMKIAQAYENMLRQKFQYIQFLENNLNNQFGQVISEEELRLFKVNQLAYIGAFIEAWQIKDFLIRAANLRKQITLLTSQLSKFENILLLIDDILRALLGINITVNQIAKGRTLCPDFLHSYCMASQNAYQINKIALGEYIENYYMALGVNPSQIYRYIPIEPVIPIMEYIKNQIGNFKNIQRLPLLTGEIKNPGELNTKKLIAETYQELEKHLILNKIISTQGQIVQILRVQKQQNQQICVQKWLFYFGFLFRAMELTHQNKCKLDEMTQKARVRQVLSWELVKKIDSETYHHIKSILVDQEIESRKIKFIYNEKLLLSQGANLTVTKLNRQKYCSLVAKSTIGEVYLSRVKALMQGVQHVI